MRLRPLFRGSAVLAIVFVSFVGDGSLDDPWLESTAHAAPPAASDSPKDQARTLAQDGIKAFESGNHQQAIDLLSRAESLFHAPVHLLFMARAHAALGKLVEAKSLYQRVANEALGASPPPAWVTARDTAKQELDELDPRVPRIVVVVTPAGAPDLAITMNDVPLPSPGGGTIEVDPGTYVFKATSRGNTVTQSVDAKQHSSVDVRLVLAAAPVEKPGEPTERPGPAPLRIVSFIAMGLGGAGLVAGGVVAGLGAKKRADANTTFSACEKQFGKNQCQGAREAEVKSLDKSATLMGNAGIGAMAGGAALLGAGIVLFVVGKKGDEPKPNRTGSLVVAPLIGPTFVGLDGRF